MDEKIRDVVKVELKLVVNVFEIHNEHVEILKFKYKNLTKLWFSDYWRHQESLTIYILVGGDFSLDTSR